MENRFGKGKNGEMVKTVRPLHNLEVVFPGVSQFLGLMSAVGEQTSGEAV